MIESAQGCSNRSVFGRLLLQTASITHTNCGSGGRVSCLPIRRSVS